MATLATHLVTAEEFLGMEFDGDCRFELDNGVVRMMGGGTARHSEIQGNILAALHSKLKGSGCRPHGPDMAARNHRLSVRYPDVSVYCGRNTPEDGKLVAFDDPKLVVEVFSPTTRSRDIEVKLPEYRTIASLDAILFVDPEDETVHLELRNEAGEWAVAAIPADGRVELPKLGLTLTHSEIFSRD
jgi:Uma2 family endonuclease